MVGLRSFVASTEAVPSMPALDFHAAVLNVEPSTEKSLTTTQPENKVVTRIIGISVFISF